MLSTISGFYPQLLFSLSERLLPCRNLLKNPPPNPQDLEMLKKATLDGIKLPGSETATTLPASLVEEAIIVSELFKVTITTTTTTATATKTLTTTTTAATKNDFS